MPIQHLLLALVKSRLVLLLSVTLLVTDLKATVAWSPSSTTAKPGAAYRVTTPSVSKVQTCLPAVNSDKKNTELDSLKTPMDKSDQTIGDPIKNDHDQQSANIGPLLVLLSVPLAWGTYEPAVRYVYALDPPVPGFVFSFSYYSIAAVALTLACLVPWWCNQDDNDDKAQPGWPRKEGWELGSYLFVGNALQLLGLQTIASDRAAFLLQLNTLFVPLIQAGLARNITSISSTTWLACAIALMGVGFMGLDNGGEVMTTASSLGEAMTPAADQVLLQGAATTTTTTMTPILINLGIGDAFIISAALVYSFHIIRLETHAKNVSAIKLAAVKATTETIWTALAIAGMTLLSSSATHQAFGDNGFLTFAKEQGDDILSFVSFLNQDVARGSQQSSNMELVLPAVYATLWTGLVTIAYTIYAQSVGQKSINAVTANFIYTIQPVYTAIFAWFLLGERLGPPGYIGAVLIACAVFLASRVNAE